VSSGFFRTANLFEIFICHYYLTRRMRWLGHVARMGEMRNVYKILVGKTEGKEHLEDLRVDGRIILDWVLGYRVRSC
jgi:hypothetical protein